MIGETVTLVEAALSAAIFSCSLCSLSSLVAALMTPAWVEAIWPVCVVAGVAPVEAACVAGMLTPAPAVPPANSLVVAALLFAGLSVTKLVASGLRG